MTRYRSVVLRDTDHPGDQPILIIHIQDFNMEGQVPPSMHYETTPVEPDNPKHFLASRFL